MPSTSPLSPSLRELPADPSGSLLNGPAVSWGAIFAGAAASAVMSLILLVLGAGLGLSSLSPWASRGASATAIGISAVVWIIVTQIMSSGLGGYIAGRLRTRWNGVNGDEVYFRDTAHGFLSWAVSALVSAVILTSALSSIISGGVQAGAALAGGAAGGVTAAAGAVASSAGDKAEGPGSKGLSLDPMAYLMDSLFRTDLSKPDGAPARPNPEGGERQRAQATAEVLKIFLNSLRTGALPEEDKKYAAQLVAQQTRLSQPEAEKRVGDIYTRAQTQLKDAETAAREAADKARKASVYASLWLFVSLLIGAFSASLSATYGGRERDL